MKQLGDEYNTNCGSLSYRIGFHYGLMDQQFVPTPIVCEEHCLCWTMLYGSIYVGLNVKPRCYCQNNVSGIYTVVLHRKEAAICNN